MVARGIGLDLQSEEDLLRFRRVVLTHYDFRMSEDCVLKGVTSRVHDISEDLVVVSALVFVVFWNNGAELDHFVLVGLVGIDAIINTRGTHSEEVRSTVLVNLLEHESRDLTVANALSGLRGDHIFSMEIKATEASLRNTVLQHTALRLHRRYLNIGAKGEVADLLVEATEVSVLGLGVIRSLLHIGSAAIEAILKRVDLKLDSVH